MNLAVASAQRSPQTVASADDDRIVARQPAARQAAAAPPQPASRRSEKGSPQITALLDKLQGQAVTAKDLQGILALLKRKGIKVSADQATRIVDEIVRPIVTGLQSQQPAQLKTNDVATLAVAQQLLNELDRRQAADITELARAIGAIVDKLIESLSQKRGADVSADEARKLASILKELKLDDKQVQAVQGIFNKATSALANKDPGALSDDEVQKLGVIFRAKTVDQLTDDEKHLIARIVQSFPPIVQTQLGGKLENHKDFIAGMTLYVDNPVRHYQQVKKADVPGEVWLHVSAVERLHRVKEDLGGEMPATTVALGLRGRYHPHDRHGAGMMAHPLGYAIDFRATENPHITDPRLVRLLELETGGPTHFQLGGYGTRRGIIAKLGRGELSPESKEAQELFKQIDAEYERLVKAQHKLKTGLFQRLSEISRAQGLATDRGEEFRTKLSEYYSILAQLRSLSRKKDKATREKVAELAARANQLKEEMMGQLTVMFEPWLEDIGNEVAKLQAEITEPALLNLDLSAEADKVTEMKKRDALKRDGLDILAQKLGKDVLQELVAVHGEKHLSTELSARGLAYVKELLGSKKYAGLANKFGKIELEGRFANEGTELLRNLIGEAGYQKLLRKYGETGLQEKLSRQKLSFVRQAVGSKRFQEHVRQLGAEVFTAKLAERGLDLLKEQLGEKAYRASLEKAGRQELARQWNLKVEMEIWNSLKRLLTDPAKAELFVFGTQKLEVKNPSIAQLMDKGFFSPDEEPDPTKGEKFNPNRHGFNKRFIETMVKHGFDLGVAWGPGSTDPMHFELVEGVQNTR